MKSNDSLKDPSMAWLDEARQSILNIVLGFTAALGAFGLVYLVWRIVFSGGDLAGLAPYLIAYGIILALFLARRLPETWRAYGFLLLIVGFSVFSFNSAWLASGGRTFLLALIISAAVLIGTRAGVVAAGLSMAIYIAYGVAFNQGWIQLKTLYLAGASSIIVEGFGFAISIAVVLLGVWALRTSLAAAARANQEARESRSLLEARADELNKANQLLEKRTAQAEAARLDAESARREAELQMWLAAGQAALAEKMRGEQDIPQLAGNLIAQLSQYLGAQLGAVYLRNGKILEQAGGYAFTARPGFSGQFQMGEGLVGQAAADQRILWIHCPENSLSDPRRASPLISTGLVDVAPRQVLIAPFEENGQVVGVIELATLFCFEQAHLDFLARISESVGIVFRSAQSRQRLADLLIETQRQAEELQAQEEELRAANEELQAQTEHLKAIRKTNARK